MWYPLNLLDPLSLPHMQLLPIHTPILKAADNIDQIIRSNIALEESDILVISSKAIATVEDTFIALSSLSPSKEAIEWSEKTGRSPEFCEAVLLETKKHHGEIVGHCPGAILTELKPDGLKKGTILTANAGLDQSNAGEGKAIGWPRNPVESIAKLKENLDVFLRTQKTQMTQKKKSSGSSESSGSSGIAVIMTDSCCRPRRLGVTAFALVVAGIDPLVSQAGEKDLFGKPLRITTEAIADQLATAANFLMGNAGQAVPAVIVRGSELPKSEFVGWVDGIEPEEDLFRGIL